MTQPRGGRDSTNVFLNVPFDSGYERLFVALIAAIVALGRVPRSVLELSELGRGRLDRLIQQLGCCRVSIHDLSRVGLPARFNMPFELGVACALAELKGSHYYILLERRQYRLDQTLSDLRGRDPYIHNGSVKQLIGCVLDVLQEPNGTAEPRHVFRLYQNLWRVAQELKRQHGAQSLFTRTLFVRVVTAATELAVAARLLRK